MTQKLAFVPKDMTKLGNQVRLGNEYILAMAHEPTGTVCVPPVSAQSWGTDPHLLPLTTDDSRVLSLA